MCTGHIDYMDCCYNMLQHRKNNHYYVAGAAIALLLIHGHPAPSNFSDLLLDMLVSDDTPTMSLQNIYDDTIHMSLQKEFQFK